MNLNMNKHLVSNGILILLLITNLFGQDYYNDCSLQGTAKSIKLQNFNRLKNRYVAPRSEDFDRSITLEQMLEKGDDAKRFTNSQAAEITGYVHDVKVGGVETCNCGAKDPLYRDTHIELVLDPMDSEGTKVVIAEVTPRWRAMMKQAGKDWTTKELRKSLLGRWIKIQGYLLFDFEHEKQAENTNPGRARNWRATAWEIHPITSIEIVNRPR
jgi:hypothetical protein